MHRIAIVDDHTILLDGLKWVVSQFDFVNHVDAFSSADQLLTALAAGNNYHVVITDLQMPKINGHELISILNKSYPNVKILVMTMFDGPYVIQKVMNTQANGFFIKQGDQSHLELALATVLAGGNYWPAEMIALDEAKNQKKTVLTNRETEILELIIKEMSTRMIAEQLFISEETVLTHRKNMMNKLDIHSTAGLVAFGLKNNFG
jgi:DNA-binding NarL/FixJ family response regulator